MPAATRKGSADKTRGLPMMVSAVRRVRSASDVRGFFEWVAFDFKSEFSKPHEVSYG
jgi:hypothetical protein